MIVIIIHRTVVIKLIYPTPQAPGFINTFLEAYRKQLATGPTRGFCCRTCQLDFSVGDIRII